MKRTYVDANVLIAAFRGRRDVATRALEVLDDPERILVVSDYLRLEVLPKPTFHKRQLEQAFMEAVLEASEQIPSSGELVNLAIEMAARYDMTPLDALHVAAAIVGGVDELVTLEKPTKPLCKVHEVRVVSLHGGSGASRWDCG